MFLGHDDVLFIFEAPVPGTEAGTKETFNVYLS